MMTQASMIASDSVIAETERRDRSETSSVHVSASLCSDAWQKNIFKAVEGIFKFC